jgi:hypothetical protein
VTEKTRRRCSKKIAITDERINKDRMRGATKTSCDENVDKNVEVESKEV